MKKERLKGKELAKALCERGEPLKQGLEVWKTEWDELATFIQPHKACITSRTSTPDGHRFSQLFTSAAIQANQILANGMVAMMVPAESKWFAFDPPAFQKDNDRVKQWYAECTEIIWEELSNSNFNTEIHEFFLDRGGFGTAAMHVEVGKRRLFNFTNLGIGTFAIAEDDEGFVDTVFRWYEVTLKQAAKQFGIEKLSPKCQKLFSDKKYMEKVKILHAIYPREPGTYDPTKVLSPADKPIASCYVEVGEFHLISEGGYDEMPTFVSRYLKWGEGFVYGVSPAWAALPDSRQLNFLEKMLDVMAEKSADPPMKAPASMEGVSEIDIRAAGVTYVENEEAAILGPLIPPGSYRYDIGKDRVITKEEAIRRAYHVDLFTMFSSIDKEMTAREVAERSAEKLIQFSPTNTRLTTELFNPLLQRIWGIAIRAGVLPPPPEEAGIVGPDGNLELPEPALRYSSRISLAIKQLETLGFLRTLEVVMPIAEARPEVWDYFNLDEAIPDLGRNNGMPARWINDDETVAAVRDARAQMQQQQIEMQQALAGAETMQKLGSVKKDSIVGQKAEEAKAA